ncbi:MAG TPA: hydrogenase maturation nickel metallochaperone HypA [Candidatus Cybelea sp.]|nr:hydrogenase maturation nickel metallochaperone HypA [Candidatus Cybelea sp.]
MHEVSVALGLLEDVQSTASEQGIDRVYAVHIRLGALTGIVRDALLFSWDVVTAQTICEGSELRVEDIPLTVYCEQCGADREPRPGSGLLCPQCATICPTVVRGREMQLVAMEVPQ